MWQASLLAVLLCQGCAGFTTVELPRKNPTDWIFPHPIEEVNKAVRKSMEPFAKEYSMRVSFHEDHKPLSRGPLEKPGNENDAFLYSFHEPISLSSMHYVGGKALPYIAEFHVHLSSFQTGGTRVEVFALNSEVIAGQSWSCLGICGPGWHNNYARVEPTTVEEYEILRRIGAELGVGTMPEPVSRPKHIKHGL